MRHCVVRDLRCISVGAVVQRWKCCRWPALKVVRAVYHGPCEGLSEAWHEFAEWIEANWYKTANDLYECYLVEPESSHDPADWRTGLS